MTARELIRKARAFYPNSKALQRKWVRVQLKYRPVPKCSMATLYKQEQLAPRERVWA